MLGRLGYLSGFYTKDKPICSVMMLPALLAPVVHVTHLDRLKWDQISLPEEQQPQPLISNFIKQQLGFHDQMS